MPELVVIHGRGGPFVCPWCGDRFGRRWIASDGEPSLEGHWRTYPDCAANRAVNNQTSSKHDIVEYREVGLVLPDDGDRDA